MKSSLRCELSADLIERVRVDVAVVTFFAGDRPLRGDAGRADWRFCGRLSRLLLENRLSGAADEAALFVTHGCMRAPLLLVCGLGEAQGFAPQRIRRAAEALARRVQKLRLPAFALSPPGVWLEGVTLPEAAEATLIGVAAALQESGFAEQLSLLVQDARGVVERRLAAARERLATNGFTFELASPAGEVTLSTAAGRLPRRSAVVPASR